VVRHPQLIWTIASTWDALLKLSPTRSEAINERCSRRRVLSGGLDSNLIAAVMARELSHPDPDVYHRIRRSIGKPVLICSYVTISEQDGGWFMPEVVRKHVTRKILWKLPFRLAVKKKLAIGFFTYNRVSTTYFLITFIVFSVAKCDKSYLFVECPMSVICWCLC
jgi:hypothetical protein